MLAAGVLLTLGWHAPTARPSYARRAVLQQVSAAGTALAVLPPLGAHAATVKQEGLRGEGKQRTEFSDFDSTRSGLQFKEYKAGSGNPPKDGDRVIIV